MSWVSYSKFQISLSCCTQQITVECQSAVVVVVMTTALFTHSGPHIFILRSSCTPLLVCRVHLFLYTPQIPCTRRPLYAYLLLLDSPFLSISNGRGSILYITIGRSRKQQTYRARAILRTEFTTTSFLPPYACEGPLRCETQARCKTTPHLHRQPVAKLQLEALVQRTVRKTAHVVPRPPPDLRKESR